MVFVLPHQSVLESFSAIPWCAAHSLAPILLVLESVQFPALHKFFHKLPIIWTHMASKRFWQNPKWRSFKKRKKIKKIKIKNAPHHISE
jgi:hypothetical protein